ncbi:MAG: DNA recombination protein RmuC [Bacteroidia bacterium]|jgi:DNA recombination protein RmuC
MELVFIIIGLILGGLIAFLWAKQKFSHPNFNAADLELLKNENKTLEIALESSGERYRRSENDLDLAKENILKKELELRKLDSVFAVVKTKLEEAEKTTSILAEKSTNKSVSIKELEEKINTIRNENSELKVKKKGLENETKLQEAKIIKTTQLLDDKTSDYNSLNKQYATESANNKALGEKLETQKQEIEDLGKKFNVEFQNIANKILEEKTAKFTHVNKQSLEVILKPLAENIDKFKKQVEDSYNNESKERFSLGEQVKEMAKLNKIISDEARNLTTALKGESKTQGNWGEMILESILEKSGLRKNETYFTEHQLSDEEGNPLRSDSENKKMRPDVVIKYPDNRSVIIDSKVSLNAFTRYLSSSDKEEQERELQQHVTAIKTHIVSLSTKGYDDYDQALDFVMMFIPSEPAYIAAMQGDSNLWNYAYDKRILLMNPTNLITSLKLIVDLWKREYQNENAIEIANRGAKLYDKFVGFVKNLEDVGAHIDKAQGKYEDAYKQLSTGNDNLVLQATKLKDLGVKNKKDLPNELEKLAIE